MIYEERMERDGLRVCEKCGDWCSDVEPCEGGDWCGWCREEVAL